LEQFEELNWVQGSITPGHVIATLRRAGNTWLSKEGVGILVDFILSPVCATD